jgi:hypothetical protein
VATSAVFALSAGAACAAASAASRRKKLDNVGQLFARDFDGGNELFANKAWRAVD